MWNRFISNWRSGYIVAACMLALGLAIFFQKYGCQSPGSKPAHVCGMIAVVPNGTPNVPVPAIAYISVNPNTPTGNGGAWGGKSDDQVVLAVELFSKEGPYCKAPKVIGLIMSVDPNASSFVIDRTFGLFGVLSNHLIGTAAGGVTSGGKLNMKLLGRGLLQSGERRYLELHLDTSGAQHGNTLAVTSGIVEYEVDGHTFLSYQPLETPPPLTY